MPLINTLIKRLAVFAQDKLKAELTTNIQNTLKRHEFVARQGHYYYPGTLRQNTADALHNDLIRLGLQRSPASSAWSWYDRDKGIMVRLGQDAQKGNKYYAEIVNF